MARAKLKPVDGARVRLLKDVTTRGGRKFRAGLMMTIRNSYGEFYLVVWVRGTRHALKLEKQHYQQYFEVVSVPELTEQG